MTFWFIEIERMMGYCWINLVETSLPAKALGRFVAGERRTPQSSADGGCGLS